MLIVLILILLSPTFIFLDAQWRTAAQSNNRPPRRPPDSYNCCSPSRESVCCPLVSSHRSKMRSRNNSGQCGGTRAVTNEKKKKKKTSSPAETSLLKRRVTGDETHVRRYHLIFASPLPPLKPCFERRITRNKGSHLCGTFAREIMAARC